MKDILIALSKENYKFKLKTYKIPNDIIKVGDVVEMYELIKYNEKEDNFKLLDCYAYIADIKDDMGGYKCIEDQKIFLKSILTIDECEKYVKEIKTDDKLLSKIFKYIEEIIKLKKENESLSLINNQLNTELNSIKNKDQSNSLNIKVRYHSDIEHLKKIEQGDWIDLRAAEDVKMDFMDYKLISLGISMELPNGYEAHVAPRSSTFKNFGIIQSNSLGIIDNSYSGDEDIWCFPAICLKKDGAIIHKGDRICQFRIVKKQPNVNLQEVKLLKNKNRGGIGSTGKN